MKSETTLKYFNMEWNLCSEAQKYDIAAIGKALSSPVRIHIIKLLYKSRLTISEVAAATRTSISSATFHLKLLEDAGIINVVFLPSKKGKVQICQLRISSLLFYVSDSEARGDKNTASLSMPVGHYVDARLDFVSGFCTPTEQIMFDDADYYIPSRVDAQLIWCRSGHIVYAFTNLRPGARLKEVRISLEICSETLYYQNDWKSDITFSLNGTELVTYTSPGDFGGRRGRMNPAWWPDQSTQYGELRQIHINKRGTFLNGTLKNKDVTINSFADGSDKFLLRIENKPDAFYKGGFNIFGKGFGDYPQDIVFETEWEEGK